ncbi:hypothetical protein C8R43DRAFT_1112849 [Mycena crocata]|nr:hypothetical protein C8R43DRAFT_1112849 [Mycena crocata]
MQYTGKGPCFGDPRPGLDLRWSFINGNGGIHARRLLLASDVCTHLSRILLADGARWNRIHLARPFRGWGIPSWARVVLSHLFLLVAPAFLWALDALTKIFSRPSPEVLPFLVTCTRGPFPSAKCASLEVKIFPMFSEPVFILRAVARYGVRMARVPPNAVAVWKVGGGGGGFAVRLPGLGSYYARTSGHGRTIFI